MNTRICFADLKHLSAKDMAALPSTKERLTALLFYLAFCYDKERFPDVRAVYQFVFSEDDKRYAYYIAVGDGRAEAFEGEHPHPTLKIASSVSDWFALLNEQCNSTWALVTRKIRIQGSLFCLLKMKEVFGKTFDHADIPGIGREIEDFEIPAKRIWKRPDKVLVINASPSRQEGFTYFYLRALLEGLEMAGAKTELIHLYDPQIKIESCRNCFSCFFKTPGQCVLNDHAKELLDKFYDATLTLFAFPMNTHSTPDKLRAFFNRTFQMVLPYSVRYQHLSRHPRRHVKEQYMAFFATSGFPEIAEFKPLVETFKLNAIFFHIPLLAAMLRPGAEELCMSVSAGEYLKKVLDALKEAGRQLGEKGRVDRRVLEQISKNYTPMRGWRRRANMGRYLKVCQRWGEIQK